MLKNKIGNDIINAGMEVPFQKEIAKGNENARKAFLHSEKCKSLRKSRHTNFDKVRVLYWNLMFLLGGICLVSVGRLIYEIIQILKM